MGKRGNKRNTKQTVGKSLPPINISLPENMSAEEMQHIIANAIIEAETIKKCKEKEQHDIALAEWHKKIGYKEYDNRIRCFFNEAKVFFRIMFLRRKDVEGDRAAVTLLKLFIGFFFGFLQFCSIVITVVLLAYIPIRYIIEGVAPFPWLLYIRCFPFAFLAFIFSRLFRMAGIEMDKLDDRNYLFGLFAAITSFVSMIIAVIAVVKGS